MSFSKTLKLTADALLNAGSIVLASHVNPDGDTLGSALALALALQALGRKAIPLSAHGVPDIYHWLPGAELIQTTSEDRSFDLAVICDAGSLQRVGSAVQSALLSAPRLLIIDHHVQEEQQGWLELRNVKAAATAEVMWLLLREMEKQSGAALLNADIAKCLMAGLITDTGSFRYTNTTPFSFALAAKLQKLGASPAVISDEVYENKSLAAVKLLGAALQKLHIVAGGRIAWSAISAADFAEMQAADADTEGIVAHLRSIAGVQAGILFREIAGKQIRVSLRSREGCDVNRVARVFGGGGHRLASGCTLQPPLEEAVKTLIEEMTQQLPPI